MKQGQVMLLSFDRPTFPRVSFSCDDNRKHKLTYSWYRSDSQTAVMRTSLVNQNDSKTLFNDVSIREEYTWGGMLFALSDDILIQQANHRDWLISIHLHEPNKKINHALFGGNVSSVTQVRDNKEFYSSWLINQMILTKADKLSGQNWDQIYKLFEQINADNPCTIMLSDGDNIVLYQGTQFSNSLYYTRSCPPHENNGLVKTGLFQFQIDPIDLHHSLVVISTEPIDHKKSTFLNLKQMIVVKNSEIIWNNDPNVAWKQNALDFQEDAVQTQQYLRRIKLLDIPYQANDGSANSVITIATESLDKNPSLYSICHKTVYEYDAMVYSSKHLIRMQPVHNLVQSLIYYNLSIFLDGQLLQTNATNFSGAFGNSATFVEIEQPYQRLEIIAESVISIAAPAPRRFDLLHAQRTIPLIWMPWDRIMMQAYLVPPELPESELRELSDYALSFVQRNNYDVLAVLNDINRTIYYDFAYIKDSTSLATTPYEVYTNHRGVCQDFANLFICLARLLNIPARYRTGYIYTAKDYINHEQSDATHAWIEVYLPYIGWLGYDPTNFCIVGKNHISVACGRIYADASPTAGTIYRGGGHEKLSVDVQVVLLDELDENQFGDGGGI